MRRCAGIDWIDTVEQASGQALEAGRMCSEEVDRQAKKLRRERERSHKMTATLKNKAVIANRQMDSSKTRLSMLM
jgi:hypothetical protein